MEVRKVFFFEVRIRIDIYFWRQKILLGIGLRNKMNRILNKVGIIRKEGIQKIVFKGENILRDYNYLWCI